jgi:hypothetical protein
LSICLVSVSTSVSVAFITADMRLPRTAREEKGRAVRTRVGWIDVRLALG